MVFPYKIKLLFRGILNKQDSRYLLRLILSPKSRVHQTSATTALNRYPDIFQAAQKLVMQPRARILSFGCSTGEEVLTLRQYFPNAIIVGSEVHESRLATCRALVVDKNITFIDSNSASLEKFGPYDAIFCMAVLQRQPHFVAKEKIKDIKFLYSFEKFDNQLIELDKFLCTGGILFIKHAHYRFCDSSVSERFEPVPAGNVEPINLSIFDKNSQIIEGNSYTDVAFRKLK